MILTLESRLVENHPKRSYGFRPNPDTQINFIASPKQTLRDVYPVLNVGRMSSAIRTIVIPPSIMANLAPDRAPSRNTYATASGRGSKLLTVPGSFTDCRQATLWC